MKPLADFRKKQVAVVHDRIRYQLPICIIGSGSMNEKDGFCRLIVSGNNGSLRGYDLS